MRILLIHNYYQDPGGEDVVFHQEMHALQKEHTVEQLTFRNRKGIRGLLQFLAYPYNLWAAFRLRQKVRSFRPDVIHVHNIHYASGPIIFRTAHRLRIPVAFTVHNYRLVCPSALLFHNGQTYMESVGKTFPWDAIKSGVLDNSILKTAITAFTYRLHAWLGTWKNIDAYLTLTGYAKDLLLKGGLQISASQIWVKPNFIAPPTLASAEKQPYFLYIGRLSEEKGVRQLLRAFNTEGAPPLLIIGDGPLRDLPTGPNITFLGYLPKEEISQYVEACKALVIPSICLEGFPLALLEGFSRQVPVMISQTVAASEIIEDEKNGFLIDPKNFFERIKTVEEHPNLEEIAQAGHAYYKERYTEESVMRILEKVYRTITQ